MRLTMASSRSPSGFTSLEQVHALLDGCERLIDTDSSAGDAKRAEPLLQAHRDRPARPALPSRCSITS